MYFHAYLQARRLKKFSGPGDKKFLFFLVDDADPNSKLPKSNF
jgi:hypothetical protein